MYWGDSFVDEAKVLDQMVGDEGLMNWKNEGVAGLVSGDRRQVIVGLSPWWWVSEIGN